MQKVDASVAQLHHQLRLQLQSWFKDLSEMVANPLQLAKTTLVLLPATSSKQDLDKAKFADDLKAVGLANTTVMSI